MTGVKIGASKDILVNVIPSLTKNLPIYYQHIQMEPFNDLVACRNSNANMWEPEMMKFAI